MTVSRLLLVATVAFAAMVACKSSSPTTHNPVVDTKVFTIKAGGYFEFLDFTADSSTHLQDTSPATIIHRHIVSTGMTMFGKDSVATGIDSLFDQRTDTLTGVDTVYFVVEGYGKRISQYGFVAGLVKQYSGGLVTIAPQWNMLVSLDVPKWLTDSTDAIVTTGFGPVHIVESTSGKNMDTTTVVVSGTSYLSGRGQHTGTANAPALLLTIPISFTVDAIFNPTAVASIITQATSAGGSNIPEHHRVLKAFVVL